jgi:hypothetical protein
MPRVANFKVLEGDTDINIGDSPGVNTYVKTFNTSDYDLGGGAYLMFMVQGLTETTNSANVLVNNVDVGGIFSSHAGADPDRVTGIVHIGSAVLSNDPAPDANELRIESVLLDPGAGANQRDNFRIRDIILCYNVDV